MKIKKLQWFVPVESHCIVYKYKKLDSIKGLMIACSIIGMYYVLYYSVFASVFFLISLYSFFTSYGIILDVENKRYKKVLFFMDKAKGSWHDLPEIKYVSIFNTTVVSTSHSISYNCIELKKKVLIINLVYNKNSLLHVFETTNYDEALNKARYIANTLKLPIYDASMRTGKWL